MATMREIRRVAEDIGQAFQPKQVILFGSHARGEATQDSDVDLLVIMPDEGRPVDQSVRIRLRIRPPFPVDILVRSPERIQERISMGDEFMREMVDRGIVLYEAHHG